MDKKPKPKPQPKVATNVIRNWKKNEFAKMVASGEQPKEAYKKLYKACKSDKGAQTGATKMLAQPQVVNNIKSILNNAGLSEQAIVKKLEEFSRINKAIVVDKKVVYVPDNATRLDATKTVLKLHGHLRNDINIVNAHDNRQVNYHYNDTDIKLLQDAAAKLDNLSKKLVGLDGLKSFKHSELDADMDSKSDKQGYVNQDNLINDENGGVVEGEYRVE